MNVLRTGRDNSAVANPDARRAAAVIAELAAEGALARIQPHCLYRAIDGGAPVRVAVIDTEVDETHPDLAGVVEARFDALSAGIVSRDHGAAMAAMRWWRASSR